MILDFQKKDWQFRDLITEGELNRIEDGIEEGVTKAEQAQTAADQAWGQAVLARSIAELHAGRHAAGGADPLTPGMIGAETPAGAQAKANTAEANAKLYADGKFLPASQYTAADILNKLKTVDGAGSGLDADTVRGYIPANKAGDTFTGNINIQKGGDTGIDFGTSPKVAGAIGVFPGWSGRLYINTNSAGGAKNVTRPEGVEISGPVYIGGPVYVGGQAVWHAGNLPIETGTWTPVLRFGESTAGITYAYRMGRYTRIANVVYWNLEINLSSKGSASGTANIAGLPFSNVSGSDYYHTVGRTSNIYVPSGQWLSSVIVNTTVYLITNTGSYFSSSEFANNSILRASGFYFI